MGIEAEVLPSNVGEDVDIPDPDYLVIALALRKAAQVARRRPSAIIIGADTTVAIDGVILGKPRDPDEAAAMLRRLSGRTHVVHTGVALIEHRSGRVAWGVEKTRVTFAKLLQVEIDAYVATRSPFDKAGGYGIQDDLGALLVERIEGDYYNVVGLPLRRLYELLVCSFADRIVLADGSRY